MHTEFSQTLRGYISMVYSVRDITGTMMLLRIGESIRKVFELTSPRNFIIISDSRVREGDYISCSSPFTSWPAGLYILAVLTCSTRIHLLPSPIPATSFADSQKFLSM